MTGILESNLVEHDDFRAFENDDGTLVLEHKSSGAQVTLDESGFGFDGALDLGEQDINNAKLIDAARAAIEEVTADRTTTGELETRNYLKTQRNTKGRADMKGGAGPLDARVATFQDTTSWVADAGSITGQKEVVYRGTEAAFMNTVPYVFRYEPPSPMDISGMDLTMAVQPAEDDDLNLQIIMYDDNGNRRNHRKLITDTTHPGGWSRIDPLPLTADGFDPTSVTEIVIASRDTPYYADSIRFVPKRFDKAKFMFTYDDGHVDQYETFFRVMDEYGMVGTIYVPPSVIDTPDGLKDEQIHEMLEHGWEVGGHEFAALGDETPEEQHRILRGVKQDLMSRGYGDIISFTYPGGDFNEDTVEIAQQYYQMCFTALNSFLGSGFVSAMSNPYFLNRKKFSGVGEAQEDIDEAIQNTSVTCFYAHTITEMSESQLRGICEYLSGKEDQIDVVTPRDILPQYAQYTL
jgi:peptidoglycan/xylan/chitin deacetylase (PgdA/CDA1 family)